MGRSARALSEPHTHTGQSAPWVKRVLSIGQRASQCGKHLAMPLRRDQSDDLISIEPWSVARRLLVSPHASPLEGLKTAIRTPKPR
jgi:hypothetical protein